MAMRTSAVPHMAGPLASAADFLIYVACGTIGVLLILLVALWLIKRDQ